MTLIKWQKENQGSKNTVFPTINDLFNDLFDGIGSSDLGKWSVPAVNISENETEFKLLMAAPGLKKEDFKILIEENVLSVSAEIKTENSEKAENFSRKEFQFNKFKRSFNLPESVNADSIKANYENGIMQLVLPKQEPVKPKTKEIAIS